MKSAANYDGSRSQEATDDDFDYNMVPACHDRSNYHPCGLTRANLTLASNVNGFNTSEVGTAPLARHTGDRTAGTLLRKAHDQALSCASSTLS